MFGDYLGLSYLVLVKMWASLVVSVSQSVVLLKRGNEECFHATVQVLLKGTCGTASLCKNVELGLFGARLSVQNKGC